MPSWRWTAAASLSSGTAMPRNCSATPSRLPSEKDSLNSCSPIEATPPTARRQREHGTMPLPGLRRRNGEEFDAELQVATTTIDDERMTTLLIRDISDTLFAEQQLVQAQKLEAIGHRTGGLAHDFNNILGIIIGSLDLVAPSIDRHPENELLAAALSAAHRGRRHHARPARRRPAPRAQAPADGSQRTDRRDHSPAAAKRRQVDRTLLLEQCPQSRLQIDAGALNNALVNLVINSRDAMPQGGCDPDLHLHHRHPAACAFRAARTETRPTSWLASTTTAPAWHRKRPCAPF